MKYFLRQLALFPEIFCNFAAKCFFYDKVYHHNMYI